MGFLDDKGGGPLHLSRISDPWGIAVGSHFEIHDAAVYRTPPAGDLNSFVECFGISDC